MKMKEEIHKICERYDIKNYTINDDGSIDVDGNVNLIERGLKRIPVEFRTVTGRFDCSYNYLTTLVGCPKRVGGGFYCDSNKLTTLRGCPERVGEDFWCIYNNITTLVGCPKEVGGHFNCHNNNLPVHIVDNPIVELQRINRNNKLNTILN